MQLLRRELKARVEAAARRSYAFLIPSPAKLEDRTQLAGIAQYSRVGHAKDFCHHTSHVERAQTNPALHIWGGIGVLIYTPQYPDWRDGVVALEQQARLAQSEAIMLSLKSTPSKRLHHLKIVRDCRRLLGLLGSQDHVSSQVLIVHTYAFKHKALLRSKFLF
jgi:hypothetical protein